MTSKHLAFLPLLCLCVSAWLGINSNSVGASSLPDNTFEPTINATGFGIDLVSNGVCTPGGNPADCAMLDNVTELTVGPGGQVALYLEWTNDGVTTFIDVTVTDGDGEKIFNSVSAPLGPGESAFEVAFFDAPLVPGLYVVPLTLTATNGDNRQGTDLVRYTLNVDAALPVGLHSFAAKVDDKQVVELSWSTAWENDNAGFVVERKFEAEEFTPLSGAPVKEEVGEETQYHYEDDTAPTGVVFYRLQQIDLSGLVSYGPILQVTIREVKTPLSQPRYEETVFAGIRSGHLVRRSRQNHHSIKWCTVLA